MPVEVIWLKEKIFDSIKALLGPDAPYEVYDQDILIHINSVISVLTQLGVGPATGYLVTKETTWADFLGADSTRLNMVRTYIYLKVRMLFDPPTSSYVMTAYQDQCKELEWRLNVAVDPSLIEA